MASQRRAAGWGNPAQQPEALRTNWAPWPKQRDLTGLLAGAFDAGIARATWKLKEEVVMQAGPPGPLAAAAPLQSEATPQPVAPLNEPTPETTQEPAVIAPAEGTQILEGSKLEEPGAPDGSGPKTAHEAPPAQAKGSGSEIPPLAESKTVEAQGAGE